MHKISSIALMLAALLASSNALRVNCQFRVGQWTFGEGYSCYGTVLDNLDPSTLVINNPGGHLLGMTNDHVTGLYFFNQRVDHIPLNLGWRFRNLKGFECDNCNITSLRSSQLQRLVNLIHFAIPRNKVKKIPGNYFRFTPRLQWVYLHNNAISNVGLNMMRNLKYLRGIYLANNGCISDNAATDRRRMVGLMHGLLTRCAPDLEDFEKEVDDSECEFVDNTSNENPPKSSKSKKSKEKLVDHIWDSDES